MQRRSPAFAPRERCWRRSNEVRKQGFSSAGCTARVRPAKNKVCQEATSYLEPALEIAKTYIAGAPPDTPYMPSALSWYISLAAMHCGPELSEDLRRLDGARMKLEIATELMKPTQRQHGSISLRNIS
ncbi:hypothetical protein ONZ51_g8490 [Trametes cubensis]|uniref:Uncharacterized protein n=1 Tax=Trametes cubensis TaxID=1111947 RepID=A0AAD7TNL1_9APHY|nr:hypothetical protein ONZ51_g8490 [Trametes cubensis]